MFDSNFGSWSLDRISLDLFSRSKVSVKFGTRSNAIFVTRSKVLLMNFFILSVDQIIFHFGTRSKVLIMVFWALKTFDQVPKKNVRILALDQKFLN